MAKFSQQFLRSLTQPTQFEEGLFSAAQSIGMRPGVKALRQAQEDKKREDEDLARRQREFLSGAVTSGFSGNVTPDSFKTLLEGSPDLKMSPLEVARAVSLGSEMAPKKVTRLEFFKQNPADLANLYKNFTSESINSFIDETGPLKPIPEKEDAKKLSSHAQRLIDQGMTEGSPEFKKAMQDYNDSLVSGKAKGMTYKGPLEQTQFLTEEFRKHPFYQSIVNQLSKVNLADSLVAGVNEGNSEQIRLMERTISELYNSDSRAASEIDRLLQGRGIKRNFTDWVSTAVAGDVSQETKDALQDILETSKTRLRAMQSAAVKSISDSYGSFVGDDVIKSWVEKNTDAQILETLTTDEVIGIYLK